MAEGKKAQVTLFVVAALILVSLAVIVFLVKPLPKGISREDINLVQNPVDNCAEEIGSIGANMASLQGGYLHIPDYYIMDGAFDVAYWYYEGEDVSPTIETIEREISSLMDAALPLCLNSTQFGFDISAETPETVTEIKDDFVILKVTYPLTIIKGDSTYLLKDFSKKIKTNLGKVYGIGEEILSEQKEHPESVCLTCLADVGEENNMLVEVGSKEESLIVRITDEESKIYEEPYKFNFALKL